MARLRACLCLMALLYLPAVAAGESETTYYAVFMDGSKIGHVKRIRTVAGGQVTTVEFSKLTMDRMGVRVPIVQSETSIETVEGEPISFIATQGFGVLMATGIRGQIDGGKLKITTNSGGEEQVRTMDWPASAVLAEGLRLAQIEKGLAEGTSYSVLIFSPLTTSAMSVQIEVGPKKKVDLLGRVVMLTEVKAIFPSMMGNMTSTDYVDQDMTMLKNISPVAGMMIEMVACDASFALSPDNPADMLAKLLVTSPGSLPVDSAKAIRYTLKSKTGEKLQFPATDNQTVQAGTVGLTVLTVRPAAAGAAQKVRYDGSDREALEALKPTGYLQSDHQKIVALARQAVGDTRDAAEAARKIEAFVAGYINEKTLSVGYASALEVAQSREGDCSEHAVLAAALCRAAGIPAQVVAGMVYVEDLGGQGPVFAGHAWTRAHVGGKWIGLDATRLKFGPGHIAQAIGNGDPAGFLSVLKTMGKYEILKAEVLR